LGDVFLVCGKESRVDARFDEAAWGDEDIAIDLITDLSREIEERSWHWNCWRCPEGVFYLDLELLGISRRGALARKSLDRGLETASCGGSSSDLSSR